MWRVLVCLLVFSQSAFAQTAIEALKADYEAELNKIKALQMEIRKQQAEIQQKQLKLEATIKTVEALKLRLDDVESSINEKVKVNTSSIQNNHSKLVEMLNQTEQRAKQHTNAVAAQAEKRAKEHANAVTAQAEQRANQHANNLAKQARNVCHVKGCSGGDWLKCSCPSGTQIMGGGCNAMDDDHVYQMSVPLNLSTWQCGGHGPKKSIHIICCTM